MNFIIRDYWVMPGFFHSGATSYIAMFTKINT